MNSANGYLLDVNGRTLRASWPAPYFVLVVDSEEPDDPMLIHCDDIAHARGIARHGGTILTADFQRLFPSNVRVV
jgi:hypothetical protein